MNTTQVPRRHWLARVVMAVVLAGAIGGVAVAPAHADERHGEDRGDHGDRGDHHDDRARHRPYRPHGYVAPAPVYAPPPVVYAPPPQPYGLNLVFPINIR